MISHSGTKFGTKLGAVAETKVTLVQILLSSYGEDVGLHNKFPSYFYKRGNLFSTYLNGGGSTSPASRKGRDVRRHGVAKPPVATASYICTELQRCSG